jgi:hypothetical protein
MFNYLFGSKTTITEKILEQNNIKVINKSDIKFDRKTVLAVTGSGKFYHGTSKNEPVTVKVSNTLKN